MRDKRAPCVTAGRLARPFAMECAEAVSLMTDYLEDALPRHERRLFERHLAGCRACLRYLGDMRQPIQVAGRLRAEDLPEAVLNELVALYRQLRAT